MITVTRSQTDKASQLYKAKALGRVGLQRSVTGHRTNEKKFSEDIASFAPIDQSDFIRLSKKLYEKN